MENLEGKTALGLWSMLDDLERSRRMYIAFMLHENGIVDPLQPGLWDLSTRIAAVRDKLNIRRDRPVLMTV